jgi:hypothetical protein
MYHIDDISYDGHTFRIYRSISKRHVRKKSVASNQAYQQVIVDEYRYTASSFAWHLTDALLLVFTRPTRTTAMDLAFSRDRRIARFFLHQTRMLVDDDDDIIVLNTNARPSSLSLSIWRTYESDTLMSLSATNDEKKGRECQ